VFSKIRNLMKSFVKTISEGLRYKTLSEKDIDALLEEFLLKLVEADVAYDVAEKLCDELRKSLIGLRVPRGVDVEEYVWNEIKKTVLSILERGRSNIDLVALAKERKPLKVVFMGVNGVGKTTTIAKIAYMLKKNGLRPVIVAADTFRAAAQEQLKKHSQNLGIPFVGGKYGSDPAAVAYDGVSYATKRRLDAVLIDTAGRMHVDTDLMNELRKIVRVVKPDLKLLVLDALTGNDAVEQAKSFDAAVGVDAVILTKVDADAKGGAALSSILSIEKPILYLGVGQSYEDLIPYDPQYVLKLIFGD